MPALRLDGDPLGIFLGDEFGVSLGTVLDEFDFEPASRKQACRQNLVSRSLELPKIAETRENLAWRFKCVCQLVEIIRKHMKRAHRAGQRSSHKALGIFRILMFPQPLVALVA
jgi:hypothetical protein